MRHDGNEENFKHRQIDGEREGVGVIDKDKNFIGEWMKIAFRKVATIRLIRYFEWCKTGDSVHRLYKKHFKHCHDMPLGKDIQR